MHIKYSKKHLSFKVRPFTQNIVNRPRRVLFNVPGSDLKKITKDYEDGVAFGKKENARVLIAESLQKLNFGRAEVCVRVNSLASGQQEKDFHSLKSSLKHVNAVVLPKVETVEEIQLLDNFLMKESPSGHSIKILAAIESAKGLLNLRELCKASSNIAALIFASEDYAADIGATRSDSLQEFNFARSTIVNYATAYKIQAIDLVCIKFKDNNHLIKECIDGFNMGFHGKQAIHPNQIETIYQNFRPSDEKIEFAKNIISSMKENELLGKGAFELDGKMIDQPMILGIMGKKYSPKSKPST